MAGAGNAIPASEVISNRFRTGRSVRASSRPEVQEDRSGLQTELDL